MAFPAKSSVQDIGDNDGDEGKSPSGAKGPPAASPKPRSAADSSLFSTAGQAAQQAGQSGLGAEGGTPPMMGMQGLALVQRGLQMLNLAFPDNPGLVAVLADITGRLQSIIPQLVSGQSNGAAGMGLFPQQPPGGGMPGGMPPGGAPPMAGPPQGMPQPPMMGQ